MTGFNHRSRESRSVIVEWLSSGLAFGRVPTHLETHISHVFIVGDVVYKLKKPVRFDFLDFTTLADRERACHDEVRLNRRLALDVYLGVVPVSFDGDELCIGG